MVKVVVTFFCICMLTDTYAQLWEQTGGPGGDFMQAATVSPRGSIFVLSQSIHHSADTGKTWRRLPITLKSPGSPYWSKFVATESDVLFLIKDTCLWRSVDSGASWSKIRASRYYDVIRTPDGHVVVGGRDSVLLTTDDGLTWSGAKQTATHLFADSSNTLFAHVSGYIVRSIDSGKTWSSVTGLPSNGHWVSIYPANKKNVIATTGAQVYLSTDRGLTWKYVYQAFNHISSACSISADTIFLAAGFGPELYRSTNSGRTWGYLTTSPGIGMPISSFVLGRSLFLQLETQIMKFDLQTQAWSEVIVPNGSTNQLKVAPSGAFYTTTALGSNLAGVWRCNNEHWEMRSIVNASVRTMGVDSIENLYVHYNNYLQHSVDSGKNWQNVLLFPGTHQQIATSNKYVFALSDNGLFISGNYGEAWFKRANEFATSLAVSGSVVYLDGRLRSTDDGFTWTEINFPLILGSGIVRSADANDSHIILNVDNTGVYLSSDWGLTWENHSEGLPRDTIWQVIETPNGSAFAATNDGLFEYSPSTKAWKNVNEGFPRVLSLALGRDGKVYAGTDGDGVWRTTKTYGTWTSDVVRNEDAPEAISIYPNPASTQLHVDLGSSLSGDFTISIYDVLGVRRLTTTNEQTLDVSSLPNGQYIVRVETMPRMQIRMLTVLH